MTSSVSTRTWYCPKGCNVFDTREDEPECAACGQVMSMDSTEYSDVHEDIELMQIAKFEDLTHD